MALVVLSQSYSENKKKNLLFGAWNKGRLWFFPLLSGQRGTARLNPSIPFPVHPHKLMPALQ